MVLDALEGPSEYRHDTLSSLAWGRYADGKGEMRVPYAVGSLFKREERNDRVYGPAGQLLAQSTLHGEIHYSYDPEGNLIEKREPGGRVWRYQWNGSGMLKSVQRPDGSEVTFGYDALGRRVRKTFRGQSTKWLWDGNVPLHEWVEGKLEPLVEPEVPYLWSADPVIKKREAELAEQLSQGPPERGSKAAPITWLFEPESFAPMAKLVGDQQFLILSDHLGTPVLMVDGAGARVWSANTSVYGELRGLEGERHACPFRWPGQYEDLETGLYYNRFRYYDPEAGQYTSQDPIGLAGGPALYGYVADPLTYIDGLGLSSCPSDMPPWVRESFLDGRAERIVLDRPLVLHRAHGGKAGKVGRFMSGDKLTSRRTARNRLALKQEWGNRVSKKTKVVVPEGTTVWRGKAAPQIQKNGKTLPGGGDQVWVADDLNSDWFGEAQHFR